VVYAGVDYGGHPPGGGGGGGHRPLGRRQQRPGPYFRSDLEIVVADPHPGPGTSCATGRERPTCAGPRCW
jgi:hypothetical protein